MSEGRDLIEMNDEDVHIPWRLFEEFMDNGLRLRTALVTLKQAMDEVHEASKEQRVIFEQMVNLPQPGAVRQ